MAYQLSFFDAAGALCPLQLLLHLLRSGSQASDFCNLATGPFYVNSGAHFRSTQNSSHALQRKKHCKERRPNHRHKRDARRAQYESPQRLTNCNCVIDADTTKMATSGVNSGCLIAENTLTSSSPQQELYSKCPPTSRRGRFWR